jgi:hypothetical protein
MTQEQITNIAEQIFAECLELRKVKGKDYSESNEDILINFKKAADKFGMTPYQILGVYMDKHYCAILNYIKNNGQSESEPIEGRINDAINYLILLRGLIEDK